LDHVDQVKVDFAKKTAVVSMKKGSLSKDTVLAAFKGTRYGVSSFKAVVSSPPKEYTITVTGMT
jgi:hypothetical protein